LHGGAALGGWHSSDRLHVHARVAADETQRQLIQRAFEEARCERGDQRGDHQCQTVLAFGSSPSFATGGIVDIELRELERRNVGGYADVNIFDTSLYFEVPPSEKLSIAVAGRRSYIDVVLNTALAGGVDNRRF
jgi:hypothetical protein